MPPSPQGLMLEAVQSSETLVNSYQSTQHYNTEDSHFSDLFKLKLTDVNQSSEWSFHVEGPGFISCVWNDKDHKKISQDSWSPG
jgi:hypothetical protein